MAGPSPTARALRLDGLRAVDPSALAALLAELPPGPWDADVAADDPLAGMLVTQGFEAYAEAVVMARPLRGLPRATPVPGVDVVPYRNAWAEDFARAEAAAMAGSAFYREMGTPTGYEGAEGTDAFVVARAGDTILGFAQAMVPEGWINWLGVVPDARRRGVGRLLVRELARAVEEGRGTHLAALVERGTSGAAFLARLGFRERSARRLLIHRGAGAAPAATDGRTTAP